MARGAFELSYTWANGKPNGLEVKSKTGNPCRLKWLGQINVTTDENQPTAATPGENHTWIFGTQAGTTYRVAFTE